MWRIMSGNETEEGRRGRFKYQFEDLGFRFAGAVRACRRTRSKYDHRSGDAGAVKGRQLRGNRAANPVEGFLRKWGQQVTAA